MMLVTNNNNDIETTQLYRSCSLERSADNVRPYLRGTGILERERMVACPLFFTNKASLQ